MAKQKLKAELAKDADKRLLNKLALNTFGLDSVTTEAEVLVSQGHYTQAFLTQWMLVENIAVHLIRTSVVCNWCESAFNSLVHQLGDLGFSQESYEKKLFEPLFSHYISARSNFEKINVDQVLKCLQRFHTDIDEFQIKQLLGDRLTGEFAKSKSKDFPKTIRKVRNELIHKNGRLNETDYLRSLPFFEYFFSVIETIKAEAA